MTLFITLNLTKKTFLLFFFLFVLLLGKSQEQFLGSSFYYGNSNWVRTSDDSYYNYDNLEYGGSFFWQRSILKKDKTRSPFSWRVKLNVISSHYTFLYDQTKEKIFRLEFLPGIKAHFLTSNRVKPFAEFLVGVMTQSGYKQRLHSGFSFSEELNLGFDYFINPKLFLNASTGWKHVSNLNFYTLNKGVDIVTIQTGIGYKIQKKSK